jgi:MFS family permease
VSPPPRRSAFVLLEAATLLSGAANGAAYVVLPWLVLERTGEASAAGLVAAATALPLLGSSLFSGTVVDMLGRRRTAVASDLLSGLAVAAIPIADLLFGLDLALIMLLAVIGAVFDPAGVTARESMLPGVARQMGWPLHRVNGIHEAVWGVAFLVGPGAAGLLIAWIGAVDTLWVATGGFLLSAACIAALRAPSAGRPAEHHRPAGIWTGTREGLAFVWHDPLLRSMMLLSAVLISVYMHIEGVLLPVYFESRDEPGRLGLLLMALSGGGVAGALTFAALGDRVRRSVAFRVSLAVTAILLVAMAFLPPFPALVAIGFALGFVYGPVNSLNNYAMQIRSTEALRGRVTGIITSTAYAAGPVGYLLAGYTAEELGVRPTFVAIALVIVGVAVVGAFLPSISHLDDTGDVHGEGPPPSMPHTPLEAIDVVTTGSLPLVSRPPIPDPPPTGWRADDEGS